MITSNDTNTGYDLTHLCDYARDIFEPEVARAFGEQLVHSQSDCRAVQLFQQVSSLGQRDRMTEVPSYAVRIVKAMAGIQPHSKPSFVRRLIPFSVTFDSLQVVHAGTRDFSSPHQRIISYEAASYSVHVKLEQETNPHSQIVVGQLLCHDPEPRPVCEIPVLVLSDGRIVGRSLTSRFGEFQAASLPPESLELSLFVGPEESIGIPLGAHPQKD